MLINRTKMRHPANGGELGRHRPFPSHAAHSVSGNHLFEEQKRGSHSQEGGVGCNWFNCQLDTSWVGRVSLKDGLSQLGLWACLGGCLDCLN